MRTDKSERSTARSRESGYALLFVFLMIAMVTIAMYAVMPRVAFEAQRDQEQLLIDRGEQYKRGLQLYFRKFKKYPGKIEDLEDTNGQRFLRQRYADPMTGKAEWRLIHVGGAGQLTDSLTQKNDKKKTDPASVNNFITELQGVSDAGAPPTVTTGIGMRRRPSDQPGGADLGNPRGSADSSTNNASFDPTNPNAVAGLPPTTIAGGAIDPNAANFSNNNVDPTGQNLGVAGGAAASGAAASQNGSGAAMIRNLLTSPRPGGPPPDMFGNTAAPPTDSTAATPGAPTPFGTPTPQNVNASGGPGTSLGTSPTGLTVGGGIAGFASKSEREGIKVYKDYHQYNKWEFIYDPNKDTSMGVNVAQQNLQNSQMRNGIGGPGVTTGTNGATTTPGSPATNPATPIPDPNATNPAANPIPHPRLPFQNPPTPYTPSAPITPPAPIPDPTAAPPEPTPTPNFVETPDPNAGNSNNPPADAGTDENPNPPIPAEDPTNPQ